MPNYKNSKIYKLVNNVDDLFYVGSTCNLLSKRRSGHVTASKKYPNQRVYKHLNTIGWNNVKIVLIEKYPCNDIDELHKRERYYSDLLKAQLNKNKQGRTQKEYYQDNAGKIKQDAKQYYKDNLDKIKQTKKQYRQNNVDKFKQIRKQYYQSNLDKINKKHVCACGGKYTHHHKTHHDKSNKHIKWYSKTYHGLLERSINLDKIGIKLDNEFNKISKNKSI